MANRDYDEQDDHGRRKAAYSLTGKRRAPLGWLPWVSLLLLGVLGAGAFLVARNVGDAGDEPGVDVVDDRAAPGQDPPGPDANRDDGADPGGAPDTTSASAAAATTAVSRSATTASNTGAATTAPRTTAAASGAGAATTAPAAGASGGAAATAGGANTLTAGGQPILPVPPTGLASLAAQPVSGSATVESVVSDEGFWVGNSPADRVFVFLTPQARTSEGESPFTVQPGQRVTLGGQLVGLTQAPADLGVDAAEGADQLASQGHLVEASSIALS